MRGGSGKGLALAALVVSAVALGVGVTALKNSSGSKGVDWRRMREKFGQLRDRAYDRLDTAHDESQKRVEQLESVLRTESDDVLEQLQSFIGTLRKRVRRNGRQQDENGHE